MIKYASSVSKGFQKSFMFVMGFEPRTYFYFYSSTCLFMYGATCVALLYVYSKHGVTILMFSHSEMDPFWIRMFPFVWISVIINGPIIYSLRFAGSDL